MLLGVSEVEVGEHTMLLGVPNMEVRVTYNVIRNAKGECGGL